MNGTQRFSIGQNVTDVGLLNQTMVCMLDVRTATVGWVININIEDVVNNNSDSSPMAENIIINIHQEDTVTYQTRKEAFTLTPPPNPNEPSSGSQSIAFSLLFAVSPLVVRGLLHIIFCCVIV